jgi:hypothetical protein
MKEKPVLFTPENIRRIVSQDKTQTRRVIKPQPTILKEIGGLAHHVRGPLWRSGLPTRDLCPYGIPKDRLWVRETWASSYQDGGWGTAFRADMSFVLGRKRHEKGPHFHGKELGPHVRWRPSIFMPRWASRITLEITDVRVQRLQEISEEDAIAEGCSAWKGVPGDGERDAQQTFVALWDSINSKKYPWKSNPFVWVISFRKI